MALLPVDMENEILYRLPPQSLFRFRSVCKRINSLFKDKSFVRNYLSRPRPQLVFHTNYKSYFIDIIDIDPNSIGPRIDLSGLPYFDLPLQDSLQVMRTCDEFLYCVYLQNKVLNFWNPWLRQVTWIQCDFERFSCFGLGYDNSRPEKAYKVLGLYYETLKVAIYDCATQVFKFIDEAYDIIWHVEDGSLSVCLNGNLYWVSLNLETNKFIIQSFDFSMETFKPFNLPCQKSHYEERLVLAVFKADRFSLLKLPYQTKEIEVWVTEKTFNREERNVVWVKLMTLPTSNFPKQYTRLERISYFIYDKTLFMCSDDYESGFAYIYIFREDLCKMIQIDSGILFCQYNFYTPNFISVP